MGDVPGVLDDAVMQRLLRIGGPTLVNGLMQLFVQRAPARAESAARAAAAGDAAAVAHAAHSLKSMAGNLGATRLQGLAEALETDIASGRVPPDLEARTDVLLQELDTVKRAIETRIDA